MSMSNYASYGDVVEDSFVRKIAPEEYNALQEYLENHNFGIEDLQSALRTDDINEMSFNNEQEIAQCEKLWKALKDKFEEVTQLTLSAYSFNAEERGDEIDGGVWLVDGVYQRTPAGERYKNEITRKHWVELG